MRILDCGAREGGKMAVAVVMEREELLYDIRNYCYVEGDLLPEDGQHQRHMVQDVGEAGNVERVLRMLDLAHADIVERLYPFTERKVYNPAVDDRMREKPVYGIVMSVPDDFSQTTLNLLGRLIHELMVCMVVADWMSITNPQKEETWRLKAEAAMARIHEVRSRRRGRVRIKGHWV